ncbi:MAG TPA: protoporphyrinogen oxidase, partial [Anaerolineales bacterium]|nr:protoporphyrinogen oxidase [Anaerolineales bacterium]
DTEDEPRPPQFMTFKDGAQVMVDALEEQLDADILMGTKALAVTKNDEGGYQIELEGRKALQANVVILAAPGNQAARMLASECPACADLLGTIDHKNIGTATLIFEPGQIDLPYTINGLMVPRRESRKIDAVTWTTNKPMDRGPQGYEMLRVFFGGGDLAVVDLPEAEIIEVIRAELADIFGITAVPAHTVVFCWPDSFPQAHVGHLELVDQIEAALPEGVYVAGSSYRGIGIPDCIRQGRDAAHKAIQTIK